MRACTRCHNPVRKRDEQPDPKEPGRVMHMACPTLASFGAQPDHTGKLHDSVQRQLAAAELITDVRAHMGELKNLIERAELGTEAAVRHATIAEACCKKLVDFAMKQIIARKTAGR